MKVIFLDSRIKYLNSILEKMRRKIPEARIVLFGTKDKVPGCEVINIPGAPEDGIAIQEWLNRNINSVDNICIVTECDTMRPLTEYTVKPAYMAIRNMLEQPYENKMKNMVSVGNMRKHF